MSDTNKQALPVNVIISENSDVRIIAIIKNPDIASKLGETLPSVRGVATTDLEEIGKLIES